MSNKQVDMFKLVEEVEKQKVQDIDSIFSDLDSLKNEEEKKAEEKKISDGRAYADFMDKNMVSRPVLPDNIGAYACRFEAFKGVIEHVSYGTSNSNAYVEGHRDALQKYYTEAFQNSKDLYVVEARVSDEVNRNTSHSQLYEKGYYDGLVYVMKALRRSKELIMKMIADEINRNL